MSGNHSTWPEWVYVGVVVALLCYVGAEAWNIERIVEHVPADAEIIKVTGQQWLWTFEHEDGTKEIGELHLEKGKAYKFCLLYTSPSPRDGLLSRMPSSA